MRINQWLLSTLFVASLTISGAAYAHDGDGNEQDGGWVGHRHHHGECKNNIPEAKRKLLHDTMRASFEKDKGLHEQAHKLHEDLKKILSANTFDEKAFTTVNARLGQIHDRIRNDRVKAFASIAAQFTQEEREEVARMLHKHHHHGRDGSGHWRHDHGMMGGDSSQSQGMGQDYPPYSPR